MVVGAVWLGVEFGLTAGARHGLGQTWLVKYKPPIQKAKQRVNNLNELHRTKDIDFREGLVARSLRHKRLPVLETIDGLGD